MEMSTQVGFWEKAVNFVKDGWSNVVSGLGSARDKRKYTTNKLSKTLSNEELESIYIEDGLGSRIITELPNDMFREGWEYTFPDLEEQKAKKFLDIYKEILENIHVDQKVKEAFYWARLYGGSVILIGAMDGRDYQLPLTNTKITFFDSLRVIQSTEIKYDEIKFQLDPYKPRYGLPELYPISFDTVSGEPETKLVHHSRIIEIRGSIVPAKTKVRLSKEQRYWGMSELQKVYDYLSTMGDSLGSVSHLLKEFSVGKHKFANLIDIISSPDGFEMMKKRVEFMDMTRSVFNSIYMDKDDEYIRENITFGGIPEVLYVFIMMVSSCSGYPITRLFGVSPAGMNSTGESDMRNYYDRVHSEQVLSLEPVLLRLVRIISEWKGIEEPYIEFRPLQQLTDKEKSELEKIDAEKEQVVANTWKTYIDSGIVEPYQAAYLQFGDDLDKIPVPEDLLPDVEPVQEPDNNANNSNEPGEDSNAEDDSANNSRISELESRKNLTDDEKKELADLKKQVAAKKGKA